MKSISSSLSKKSEQTWLMILILVSLVTVAVHYYLTAQHFQLKLGLAESRSVCNVSTLFNCDSVSISRFATLFGIPMALLGLLTQLVFLVLLLSVKFHLSSTTDWLRRSLLWFSFFIVGVSLVMAFFSSFYLGTFCLFCIAVYVLSIVQLFGAWKIQETGVFARLGSDLQMLLTQTRWVLVLAILIPVAGWILNSVILDSYGLGKLKLITADALGRWESSPTQSFKPEDGLTMGASAADAKITIVEFADYLCPHCKTASPTLEAFIQVHPDARLVYKMFPLDGKCNKSIEREGDGTRCRLSAAVLCAEQLAKKGWETSHWVFDRQEELSRGIDAPSLSDRISADLGLEKAQLQECMSSDPIQDKLMAMAQEGAAAQIQGTPTIFVNGRILERGQFLPVLEALYKKLNP